MKTLQYANVETFIVFRCSTPIIISVADWLFLGRELPSLASWGSLVGLLAGAIGYATTDSNFDGMCTLLVVFVFSFCFCHSEGIRFCDCVVLRLLPGSDLPEARRQQRGNGLQLGQSFLLQLCRLPPLDLHGLPLTNTSRS